MARILVGSEIDGYVLCSAGSQRLALPTGAYYTGRGTVLEGIPIEPDHTIEFDWQDRRLGTDRQLDYAIKLSRGDAVVRGS